MLCHSYTGHSDTHQSLFDTCPQWSLAYSSTCHWSRCPHFCRAGSLDRLCPPGWRTVCLRSQDRSSPLYRPGPQWKGHRCSDQHSCPGADRTPCRTGRISGQDSYYISHWPHTGYWPLTQSSLVCWLWEHRPWSPWQPSGWQVTWWRTKSHVLPW